MQGYSRKGAALELLDRFEEAKNVYEEGLKFDSANAQLVESLNKVKEKLEDPMKSFQNPFASQNLLANLAASPQGRALLGDPEVIGLIQDLQKNPNDIMKLLNHPKGSQLLQAMMGGNFPGEGPMETDEEPPKPEPKKEEPKKEDKKKAEQEASKANMSEEQRKVG